MNLSFLHVFSLMMMLNRILAALIGQISNASLLIAPINTTINATTCNECLCNMIRSSEILSLNCFQTTVNQVTCPMFTQYTYTVALAYRVESSSNSTFYFQQLPPEFPTTTVSITTATGQRSWRFGVITQLGDAIVGLYNTTAGASTGATNGRYSGANETPPYAIDGLTGTKYLNFGGSGDFYKTVPNAGVGTGFYVTPNISDISIATGLRFATANDAAGRDPLSVTLEGTNSTNLDLGSSWTLIYSGPTGINPTADPGRMIFAPQQNFSNRIPFRSYRLLITAQRANEWAVQYAEAAIIGLAYV